MSKSPFVIGPRDIQEAGERIVGHVYRTPVVPCEVVSQQLGCEVHFKAESLQYAGAFKARGAMNAVLALEEDTAAKGVVTHSSGNHAAALARAAVRRGIPAHVVMPRNSARIKIQAVQSYGVEPVFCEPTAESRQATAERVREQTGSTLIHPYNDPAVMAGQGTVALELLQQLTDVDFILAPVGGGGLLSGVLMWVKSQQPHVKIIAAEPELADDAARSLRSGQIEMPTRYDTIADGLRTPLGSYTFPIIHELLDDILLVGESAIREAMRTLAQEARLVVEPSGAVTLAALTAAIASGDRRFEQKKVVAVVSGGNFDSGDGH